MRNTKRTISVLLALTMVVSLFPVMPVTVFAEEYAPPFGELSGGKYTLESDWYQLTEDFAAEGYIYVPSDVKATIDLNGHTIDRGLATPSETGCVIKNEGTLTITDSGGNPSGKLTGGYAKCGGAVYNSGTLTLEGGTITGNCATESGGAVYNSGTLTIMGGTVTGNFADLAAGGIYNCDSATLNMDGSPVIKDNANGNLWLGGDSVITTGQFLSGAAIDVRADNMTESRAITAGFNYGNCDMFSFSYGATWAKLDNNGEVIPDVAETITVYTWDELILLSDKTL